MIRAIRPGPRPPGEGQPGERLARYAWLPVALVAAVLAAVLVATANQYGYHRDELYFRMLASHPAWGYVDQPPLTPMLVRVCTGLFGDSLLALRLPAILSAVVTIALTALVCRELGGRRFAQVIAAIGISSTFLLIAGHVLLTASPDMVFWVLTILFIARALMRDEPRWWLYAGVTVGVSFFNKQLIVLLLIGLAAGLLITGPRRHLASPALWLGVAIAVLIASPTFVYQVTHGWPELHMAGALADHKGADDRALYLPFQLVLLGPTLVPIWFAGLLGLFRDPRWRSIRAFGWAYPLVSVIVLISGGQVYYTFGLLALYYAAGCVRAERWVGAQVGRSGTGRAGPRRSGAGVRIGWIAAALTVSIGLGTVIALPLIPVTSLGATGIGGINQTARDQVGWPAYVRQVGSAYAAIPAADRARTALIAGNYGEAGALDRFGKPYGLPQVYSGQNQLYEYGPPPAGDTIALLVGYGPFTSSELFASCQQVGTLDDEVGVDNEEQGRLILLCRDPVEPWPALWPLFQHYD